MFVKRRAGGNRAKGKDVLKKVQFEFSSPEAHEVFIVGEFNHWDVKANPLIRDKSGVWKVTLSLKPGKYEYRYLTDGKWENDPSCSSCVPNEFGSQNCVRVVK